MYQQGVQPSFSCPKGLPRIYIASYFCVYSSVLHYFLFWVVWVAEKCSYPAVSFYSLPNLFSLLHSFYMWLYTIMKCLVKKKSSKNNYVVRMSLIVTHFALFIPVRLGRRTLNRLRRASWEVVPSVHSRNVRYGALVRAQHSCGLA